MWDNSWHAWVRAPPESLRTVRRDSQRWVWVERETMYVYYEFDSATHPFEGPPRPAGLPFRGVDEDPWA